MKTLINTCFVAIILFIQLPAYAQEQPIVQEHSTQATLRLPKSLESAYKTVTELSIVSTYATVHSTSSNALDSLSRKDDSAIIVTALSTSDVGIGGKLWVTEQTVIRAYLNMGLNLQLGLPVNIDRGQIYAPYQRTVQNTSSIDAIFYPGVSNNSSLSASLSIEKHIFPRRTISPFLGVGIDVSVRFSQLIRGNTQSKRFTDSTYFTNAPAASYQTTSQSSSGEQSLNFIDSYKIGGSVFAGVEYFVLPSVSLSAQVGVAAGVRLAYQLGINNSTTVPNQTVLNPNQNVYSNQQIKVNPTIGFEGNTWFGISGLVYLGRGAAKEFENAFLSIFSSW